MKLRGNSRARGNSRGHRVGVLRVMLDSNIFDRLAADGEAASELENRGDLRPIITELQLAQLAAIPEPGVRSRYLELADRLCAVVSAAAAFVAPRRRPAAPAPAGAERSDRHESDRHDADRMIAAAAAARCDILVSDDRGLLEHAKRAGLRAMDWDAFVERVLFRR